MTALHSQAGRSGPSTVRSRRGVTMVEMVIAGVFLVMILSLFAALSRSSARLFVFGVSDATTQAGAEKALQTAARDVRRARRLVSINAAYTDITLQMPAYDAGGNLALPIADGNTVRYYVSAGQVIREEAGSQQALVKLGGNGIFTMTPTFVDENGDGVLDASEMRAVRVHVAMHETSGGASAMDRSYDSKVTSFLHNRTAGTLGTPPPPNTPGPYPASPGEGDDF